MNLKLILFFCLFSIAYTHLEKRILRGNRAYPYSFPNIVLVHSITINRNKTVLFCSGTVYNKDWISSTGYCLSQIGPLCKLEDVRVAAGKWNITQREYYQQIRSAVFVRVHEDYDAVNVGKSVDLGLLKLNESLILNNYVMAIPFSRNLSYPLGPGAIAGWGPSTFEQLKLKKSSDVMNYLFVIVKSFNFCQFAFKIVVQMRGQQFTNDLFNNFHFCTGTFNSIPFGPIHGDAGGPMLQVDETDSFEVVGLISSTIDYPYQAIYIQVSHFIDWFERITSSY